MEARWRCGIMGMEDKVSDKDIGGRAWWRRCGKTGMDTAAEDMWDGNRRDVGQKRWRNELEKRQRTGKISTGNDYQPEGVSSIR